LRYLEDARYQRPIEGASVYLKALLLVEAPRPIVFLGNPQDHVMCGLCVESVIEQETTDTATVISRRDIERIDF
jgi:hypothetical protein